MSQPYRVLARKYRPQHFDDLVGQDVLVRTLRNGIKQNRIAHAFLLTGIRGIGKTTTARIIAKALNCLGADGQADGPTENPCCECINCEQIRDDRHVDVMEMDAASRTGVNDIREIIDSIYYKPSAARYKIYIIDEAHMLSNSAFNALLKTLEEPPEHVIFIFATTEIRKIPVTILSRCQRFDLRRLNTEELTNHLANIAQKEHITAQQEALELIAIAAEGSVRDGLSLLDQAIAHQAQGEQQTITVDLVRGLLGLVDRTRLYTMLEHLFKGECEPALTLLKAQYNDGADMINLVQDMMQSVHIITRLLVAKEYVIDRSYSDHEQEYLHKLANMLHLGAVTKAWQLLMKGCEEIKHAPNALMATEMLFVRFVYAANMPDPSDLIKQLREQKTVEGGVSSVATSSRSSNAPGAASRYTPALSLVQTAIAPDLSDEEELQTGHLALVADNTKQLIISFEEVVALCEAEREPLILHQLKADPATQQQTMLDTGFIIQ